MNSATELPETEIITPKPAIVPMEKAKPRARLGLIAFVVCVVVICAAIAGFFPRWHQKAALKTQTADLSIPFVSVTLPQPTRTAPGLELPAEVKPFVESPIYARANGYLKKWLVDIGAHVEAGQLLAEIDTPELNQELERARAQLAESEAALELAKATSARWKELLKTSSVSEQEALEKQSDLTLKQATLEAGHAEVRRLEQLQGFEKVTAPFAGTITERQTDVGALISTTSGKPLFILSDVRKLRVYVRIPQTLARDVKAGDVAELDIPEMPNNKFEAKVIRTSGAMSAESRTLLAELEVDNSKGEILAGSYAQIRFSHLESQPVLSVPSTTLIFRSDGAQLAVVGADNKIELRKIKAGRDFGRSLEVLSGLGPADRVILNPSDSLVNGTVVKVVESGK